MEQVKQIYKESGYPAPARLFALVKSKGITGVTLANVKAFVESQAVAQLHKQAPSAKKNATPITVSGKNVEYQMDLLDESSYSASNKGHKWILIVEDIFDRRCAAIPTLKSKSPNDVLPALQEALKQLGALPVQIVSDSGSEWKGVVDGWLNSQNIVHRTVQIGDHNSLGVIDSCARFVKNALAKHFTATQTTEWITYLPTLMKNYNDTPHSTLKEKGEPAMSPNEAEKFESDTRNIWIAAKDKSDGKKKPSGFEVGTHVRILKRKEVFQRGYEIRYSKEVFTIASIEGLWYKLNDGRKFREGSLQKVRVPKSEESKEAQPEILKDVHREAKFHNKTENILKFKEGVSADNVRRGDRERAPSAAMAFGLGVHPSWYNI